MHIQVHLSSGKDEIGNFQPRPQNSYNEHHIIHFEVTVIEGR